MVSDAIENGSDADAFSEILDSGEEEFDPFEALMAAAADTSEPAKVQTDETLFSDADYLYMLLWKYSGRICKPIFLKLSSGSSRADYTLTRQTYIWSCL